MSSDPQKLEEASEDIERLCDHHAGRSLSSLRMGIAAARAHLATLPRYKEVEVEKWAVIDASGGCIGAYDLEKDALTVASGHSEWFPVRLTGTAKVKVTP